MRLVTLAAFGLILLVGPSADPTWRAMPHCLPHELARCLPLVFAPLDELGTAIKLTGGIWNIAIQEQNVGKAYKVLRSRRIYVRTSALDAALAGLRDKARDAHQLSDLGWLYLLAGDRTDAARMFKIAAIEPFSAQPFGTYPVDGLLRLGLVDDALAAARSMKDTSNTSNFAARDKPAALGSVALALFLAGRHAEAERVLAEAYGLADQLPPGYTMFGYGPAVDAAKFRAYAALVRVQIAFGDLSEARSRARAAGSFRLAMLSDELNRVDILRRTGLTSEAETRIRPMLTNVLRLSEHGQSAEFYRAEVPSVAASLAAVTTLDEAVASLENQNDESRSSFGVLVLSQWQDCTRAGRDIAMLAGRLHLQSRVPLMVEAAAVCAMAGDEARASHFLEEILDEGDTAVRSSDYADVAFLAYALQRGELVERTIFADLHSDGTATGVRDATFNRASSLASELLHDTPQVVSGDRAGQSDGYSPSYDLEQIMRPPLSRAALAP